MTIQKRSRVYLFPSNFSAARFGGSNVGVKTMPISYFVKKHVCEWHHEGGPFCGDLGLSLHINHAVYSFGSIYFTGSAACLMSNKVSPTERQLFFKHE